MKLARGFVLIGFAFHAAALVGCGAKDVGPPVVQVKGQINFEGRPIPGAIVTLHPVSQAANEQATKSSLVVTPFGIVDQDGSFQLTTRAPADGAPEGEYHVTVSWPTKGGDSDNTYEQLPPKYQVAQSSGLKLRVSSGQRELEPLTLTR